MLKIILIIVITSITFLLISLLIFLFLSRPRRRKEDGFKYIYVNDDGTAKELNDDEKEYLNTDFHNGDGARPYIKFRYQSRTPDSRLSGYLERRQLPKNIHIEDF